MKINMNENVNENVNENMMKNNARLVRVHENSNICRLHATVHPEGAVERSAVDVVILDNW